MASIETESVTFTGKAAFFRQEIPQPNIKGLILASEEFASASSSFSFTAPSNDLAHDTLTLDPHLMLILVGLIRVES